jgi:hypothetical protein
MEHISEDIYVEFDIKVNKIKPVLFDDYIDNRDKYNMLKVDDPSNNIVETTVTVQPPCNAGSFGPKLKKEPKKDIELMPSYIDNFQNIEHKYREKHRKNINRIGVVALSSAVLAGGIYMASMF